jgi:aspartokinase-like uncharacterized kinase
MWVFKLGGSLLSGDSLTAWLSMLAQCGRGKVVIVPGGGIFADTVRQSQKLMDIDDHSAHRMAILAMAQYGYALCAIEPRLTPAHSLEQLHACLADGNVPVWLPFELLASHDAIEESWRTSSDSLAAWLAGRINAHRLVLVKSAEIADGASLEALASAGIVDPLLAAHACNAAFTTSAVDANAVARVRDALTHG